MQKKYIAPNAITVTNMFLGYLSIISSTKGEFDKAVLFIFLAMICDGLGVPSGKRGITTLRIFLTTHKPFILYS